MPPLESINFEGSREILDALEGRKVRCRKPVYFQLVPDDKQTQDTNEQAEFLNGLHEDIRGRFAFTGGSVGTYDWNRPEQMQHALTLAQANAAVVTCTHFPGRNIPSAAWGEYGTALAANVGKYANLQADRPHWAGASVHILNFEDVKDANTIAAVRQTVTRFLHEVVGALRVNVPGCQVLVYNEHFSYQAALPWPRLPLHEQFGDAGTFSGFPMDVGTFATIATLSTIKRPSWVWLWLQAGHRFAHYWNPKSAKRFHRGPWCGWDHEHAMRFFSDVGKIIGANENIPGVILHRPEMDKLQFAQRYMALLDGIDEGVAMLA